MRALRFDTQTHLEHTLLCIVLYMLMLHAEKNAQQERIEQERRLETCLKVKPNSIDGSLPTPLALRSPFQKRSKARKWS